MNFKLIGEVSPKHSKYIKHSRIGIGLEKLDRSLYDPEKCYDAIGNLGVGYVRIQSGWMKTEKEKGVYDFSWLDPIVDNIILQGAEPWMCLCYGNPIYTEAAKSVNGAIGIPPIRTKEERDGWSSYCHAVAEHFKGRVSMYEVWNEPDLACWRPESNATEYGEFVTATAKAVKSAAPESRILAGSLVRAGLDYLSQMFATGCYKYIDAITYHHYKARHIEEDVKEVVADMKAFVATYDPKITIIMGEHGAPSRRDGKGALASFPWTEEKQAKFLARKIMIDLISGVEFASYFTLVDIFENLEGEFLEINEKNYGFFGLLKEHFKNGNPTGIYEPKPSYRMFQCMCALFSDDAEMVNAPIRFSYPGCSDDFSYDVDNAYYIKHDAKTVYQSFKKSNKSFGFCYWKTTDIMTTSYSSEVTIEAYRVPKDVHFIDCLKGKIYEISKQNISVRSDGKISLKNMPIYDYPVLITFGNFCEE